MQNIGFRIKELRTKKKLTQAMFSEILNIKQANLSHIENKGTKISMEIIAKIISKFNISAEWLITGNGLMLRGEQSMGDISNSTIIGANVVKGNSNKVSHVSPLDITEQLRVKDEQLRVKDEQLRVKDEQIDRLLGMLEKLNK